ncbi:MAG: LD-carboxypeptidase [Candidatus Moranbacteria bacterium CG23_combo_of_CG06-09_8_20_14_all_35_22]|nr:MAG: LD-carboxypeptidase [Candidatus Moranbacteria bacterium CG23_combo_of_CG06-09_8_20_14_all_35_22]
MFPKKLKKGDTVQVIAPASSLGIISQENREISNQRFQKMGLKLIFGKHVEEIDDFNSSSIESRIEDLHEAFRNPKVKVVLCVIGGFNSNQLLKYIDWNLIKNNPKIFCGFSDITALGNAIFAKTGLVNYSGPAYANFSEKKGFDYTLEYFEKCLFSKKPFEIKPSQKWSDDKYYLDQKNRTLFKNKGPLIVNEGEVEGTLLGGNLCTLNLLQGTQYFPDISNSILFIENDYESNAVTFDRNLQSLLHLPNFDKVRGIVFGRFQRASEINNDKLIKIIKTKKELDSFSIIINADFGHTQSMITFPIGGRAKLSVKDGKIKLEIIEH